MVKGLDTFREFFKDFEEQYVLIGGAACDILFASNEGQFRATRDLDMVYLKCLILGNFSGHIQHHPISNLYSPLNPKNLDLW